MEVFSIYITWTDTTNAIREERFTCVRAQVINQVNLALTNDVAPTFAQNCQISIQSLGNIRGPLS